MLTIDTDRWTQFLLDKQWWLEAWQASVKFAPRCIPCAAAIAIANLIVVGSTELFMHTLRSVKSVETPTDFGNLLLLTLGVLCSILFALGLTFWALWDWLVKLTAFAKLLLERQPITVDSSFDAIKQTAKRKGYLMKLWFVASLILLVPAIPLSMAIGFHSMLTGPTAMLNYREMPLPAWIFAPTTQIATAAVTFVLTVLTLAYTFVTVAFSAISQEPAGRTAWIALRQTAKHLLPLSAIAAIILLANLVITAPQVIIGLGGVGAAHHPAVEAIAQVWLGIASPIVWPLSLAPFCRLVQPAKQATVDG
jgi:hypothetical protein